MSQCSDRKNRCHAAFPVVKTKKQNNPKPSSLWANPNSKPKEEMNPRQKIIASVDDFKKYVHELVHSSGFSKGVVMFCVPQNFKENT